MAEICCGVVSKSETAASCEPISQAARCWRMEIRRFKFVAGVSISQENCRKRPRLDVYGTLSPRDCKNAIENCGINRVRESLVVSDEESNTEEEMTLNE
uniref:Uncharacterized protein n=1 Tax=Nelumbo nucifera TaxID=4432 RepID=A0A822XHF4_NELNU|nr:TPA_asm: hypothetical protein HUJ06_019899 [Nelumbo nucifera]